MSWSPPDSLQQNLRQRVTRAQENALRDRVRQVKEGDAALSARGVLGGPSIALRRDAAERSVRQFAEEAVNDVLSGVESVYNRIPPEAVEWLVAFLSEQISRFGSGTERWVVDASQKFNPMGHWDRRVAEVVGRVVEGAIRDLKIRLGTISIRHEQGIEESHDMNAKTVIYNVTGANSRVNVQSVDSSTNVVNIERNELFVSMRRAVEESGIDTTARAELLNRIEALESAKDQRTFAQKYADFIQSAANHIALFAPFLPALAQLLGS